MTRSPDSSLRHAAARVTAPLRRRYRNSWLWRVRHPRPFHVIGLGTPKAGTHSVAYLLAEQYHAVHEAEFTTLIPHIVAYHEGRETEAKLRRTLRQRDHTLYPAVDVAHYYGEIAPELVAVFPRAKFVVTIRDCYSWLPSLISHMIGFTESYEAGRINQKRWGPIFDLWRLRFGTPGADAYPANERPLYERGVPPLETLLRFWTEHNTRILRTIPEDRRLVIRTRDLGHSLPTLAAFLDIPVSALDRDKARSFVQKHSPFPLWETVEPSYVEALAARHCAELMEVYFPEVQDASAAVRRSR